MVVKIPNLVTLILKLSALECIFLTTNQRIRYSWTHVPTRWPCAALLSLSPSTPMSSSTGNFNVTVDDQGGDEISSALPIYSPVDSWSQGNGCSGCALHPDPTQAFNSSWHDTTFYADRSDRNISINFTGVAVYAFFIIPDKVQGDVTVGTNLVFTLDGERAGTFTHSPTGAADFLYDVPCFVKENLVNSSHQLVIAAAAPNGSSSVILFDYLKYTSVPWAIWHTKAHVFSITNDSASSNSSAGAPSTDSSTHRRNVSIGAVVGGTMGGVVAAVLLLVGFIHVKRSRSRRGVSVDISSPSSSSPSKTSWRTIIRPREIPSVLNARPAVFDEHKPEEISPTSEHHSYLINNEKRAQFTQRNGASSTTPRAAEESTLTPSPCGTNAADIPSRVATLEASVLSLQGQQLDHQPSNNSDVGAPPAYSHDL